MARMKASEQFRCFCGHVCTGPIEKREHMSKAHGLTFGYQNTGRTGHKPEHWRNYRGKIGKVEE